MDSKKGKEIILDCLKMYNPSKSKIEAEIMASLIMDKLDFDRICKYANEYEWQAPPQPPNHMI